MDLKDSRDLQICRFERFADLFEFFLAVEFVAHGGEEEDVDVADEEQQVGFLVSHLGEFA